MDKEPEFKKKMNNPSSLRKVLLGTIVTIFVIILGFVYVQRWNSMYASPQTNQPTQIPFISSIDTMKYSRDTETYPQTQEQIAEEVNTTASLEPGYITVDTHWDYWDRY